ncbi:MAG TPA: hypothetical protein VN201_09395 [Roseateles sp.]|nr:hypothetical protein [Roseateles sp.]
MAGLNDAVVLALHIVAGHPLRLVAEQLLGCFEVFLAVGVQQDVHARTATQIVNV